MKNLFLLILILVACAPAADPEFTYVSILKHTNVSAAVNGEPTDITEVRKIESKWRMADFGHQVSGDGYNATLYFDQEIQPTAVVFVIENTGTEVLPVDLSKAGTIENRVFENLWGNGFNPLEPIEVLPGTKSVNVLLSDSQKLFGRTSSFVSITEADLLRQPYEVLSVKFLVNTDVIDYRFTRR